MRILMWLAVVAVMPAIGLIGAVIYVALTEPLGGIRYFRYRRMLAAEQRRLHATGHHEGEGSAG